MDASIAQDGPSVQPIPKPTEQQRLQFAKELHRSGRVGEWPGACVCYCCLSVQRFTGRGALPKGWQPDSDHRLNARWRLASFMGRGDIARALWREWSDLAHRAAQYWDSFEPDGAA